MPSSSVAEGLSGSAIDCSVTKRIHAADGADESDSWIAPYIKPQMPMVCDLVADPHETIDLMQSDLTAGWVIAAAMAPVVALQRSTEEFPHIKPGQEFDGYD